MIFNCRFKYQKGHTRAWLFTENFSHSSLPLFYLTNYLDSPPRLQYKIKQVWNSWAVEGPPFTPSPHSTHKFVLNPHPRPLFPVFRPSRGGLTSERVGIFWMKFITFKGTVQRDFNFVFWHILIGLGLNMNRFYF